MSQFIPEEEPAGESLPLMSLSDAAQTDPTEADDMMYTMQMIDEALQSVGKKKYESTEYPTYYDDMLMQLIDAVPLE